MRRAIGIVVWLMVAGVALMATGATLTVDASGAGDYTTIQAAIDAASAGDTIEVAAGTYALSQKINVTKPLTILGAQANVDPRPSVGGRIGPEALLTSNTTVFDIQADDVVINGFTIQANISNSGTNIIHDNNTSFTSRNATVTHNIITNIGSTMNEAVKIRRGEEPLIAYNYIYDIPSPGDAINFDRVMNGRIEYNEIVNSGSDNAAIYIYDSEYTWIVGNIVDTTTKNDGIKLGRKSSGNASLSGGWIIGNLVTNTAQDGITVYTSDVLVEGNTVTGATTENGAIYLAFGISNIVIRNNTIVDNTLNPHKWGSPGGITIGSAVIASTVEIYGNTIMDNYPVDVANMASGSPLLDATGNWWGQDTGPLPAQIAGNVAYSPWLGNEPSEPVWTFVVAQVGPELAAGYLQTGLDIARDGDTVFVTAGDYVTQGLISKGIVLQGEPGAVVKAPGSQTYTIAETGRTLDPIIFAYGGTMVGSHVSGSAVISADVKGLVVDGQNKAQAHPIRFVGVLYRNVHGEISGNAIQNMMNPGGGGGGAETFGILVYGDSVVDILDNVISGFSRGGIGIFGDLGPAPDPVANVSGNVVIGNGLEATTGWWAENGIQIGYGATGIISGNLVTQCWVNNPNWTATGVLVAATDDVVVEGNTVLENQSGIGVAGFGVWGWPSSNDTVVRGNDVTENMWGVDVQMDANNTLVIYNNIAGNTGAGVSVAQFYGYEPVGTVIRFNSIVGNAIGVENYGVSTDVNAALNWWGSADGPTHAGNPSGTGDAVSDNVIYSPWLGMNPDGEPLLPGVQITEPLYIVVAPVGPEPAGGYLNMAIEGSNEITGVGAHTIGVRAGTYDASASITNAVEIVREGGTATNTILTGPMSIASADVLVGRFGQGFTIHGPITVGSGVDASRIRINWNNIYGVVTNEGRNTLDATFNYWGEDGPETVGRVNVFPVLPMDVDSFIEFMSNLGVSVSDALLLYEIDERGLPWIVFDLMQFGLSMDEASSLVREYGQIFVGDAVRAAGGDYDRLATILLGYVFGAPAGGGGADGEIEVYSVGDTITFTLDLVHPVTGEPLVHEIATLSLMRTLEDGRTELVAVDLLCYCEEEGVLVCRFDTTGYDPGVYEVVIGTSDLRHHWFQIELVEE